MFSEVEHLKSKRRHRRIVPYALRFAATEAHANALEPESSRGFDWRNRAGRKFAFGADHPAFDCEANSNTSA